MSESIYVFRDLAMVFAGAFIGGLLFWWMRQPLILGYVLAGLVLSPLTPGPRVHNVHIFEEMAETGVILLMFSTGIEFSVTELLRVKWIALIGAPIGISLSIGLTVGVGRLLGWPLTEGLAVGGIICVASTMVLLRLLMDRGELNSDAGRVMLVLTLLEDLVVVALTVLIPGLAGTGVVHGEVFWKMGQALLLLIPVVLIGWKIVPPMLARLEKVCHEELSLLFALALCLVTAAITEKIGLSLAFGAFVGGMMLGTSGFARKLGERTLPIRDAFVALFFVSVGMLIDPRSWLSDWRPLVAIIGLVLFGKFAVWFLVVRVFGYPARTAVRVAAGLTQIGEFSFVLAHVALHAGLIPPAVYSATLTASMVTILANATLFRLISGPAKASLMPARATVRG
ncbi:MAG: cation:proton antiporter [Chthoniobacteraceae bacterium]|jgi:CPA2 family monovalent cation:H+ antiporter-2